MDDISLQMGRLVKTKEKRSVKFAMNFHRAFSNIVRDCDV